MTKYIIDCYDGEYDHETRAFDSKEEAEKFAELIRNLFCPNHRGVHEFGVEVMEIEQ